MKKNLLTLVVLSAISSISSAQSAVTLFGVVDLGLRHVRNGSAGSALSEVNGANATSRWGIRGAEDLGSGLSAQFWLESGINADTGSSTGGTQLFDRRSTLGIASDRAGEVRLGRDYRPTHNVWSSYDPYTTVGLGSANQFNSASVAISGSGADVTRASNSLQYFLPGNVGGVTGALFLSTDEGSTLAAGAAKSKGGRIGYASGPINVAASLVTVTNTPTFDLRDSVIGGSYDFGIAKVALARRTFKWGADQQALTLLAVTAPVGAGTIKASYLKANQSGASATADGRDASQIALGYVYSLSKRTALHGAVSHIANKNTARFVLPGGPAGIVGGEKSSGYEVGLRHSF